MSQIEDNFAWQLRSAGVDGFEREAKFHPLRKWRFDFCWRLWLIAVEIDGGAYVQGRHNRGAGMAADNEKINEAILLGWRVLRFTAQQVENGYALDTVMRALEKKGEINR